MRWYRSSLMKSFKGFSLALLLVSILMIGVTIPVMGQECQPKEPTGSNSLLILPFKTTGKKESPETRTLSTLIPILLKDYLGQSKKIAFPKTGARYLLKGTVTPGPGSYPYHISLRETDSQKEIYQSEGRIDFPSKINDALLTMTEQVAKALGAPLPIKKLLPLLNVSNSPEAYHDFAEGRMALQSVASSESAMESAMASAIQAFEKSIQHDYNYVPAYLGLAEALAMRSSWERLKNHQEENRWGQRAKVELEKAKILNPALAKNRQGQMEWYLKHACKGEVSR